MIKVESKMEDENFVFKEIRKFLTKGVEIRVGFLNGNEIHKGSGDKTINEIMQVHEYGAYVTMDDGQEHWVPKRSVVGDYFDSKQNSIFSEISEALISVFLPKKISKKIFEKIAQKHAKALQDRIKSRISPPLHPMTIAKRKHSGTIPLYDTKQLHDSIKYEVK